MKPVAVLFLVGAVIGVGLALADWTRAATAVIGLVAIGVVTLVVLLFFIGFGGGPRRRVADYEKDHDRHAVSV